jgi:hypothetical protein
MPVLEYHCRRHGIVAAIERSLLRFARPPTCCPICKGDLSVHLIDYDATA